MKIARYLQIEGRVQGVGFRYQMQAQAQQLGLTGWVRNRQDGSVEAVVCSENMQLIEDIVAWARQGPRFANVIRVEVSETEAPPQDDFVILPTA
jgi:acylphosphatase